MTKHMIGTREEWLAARLELLKEEKGAGRQGIPVRHRHVFRLRAGVDGLWGKKGFETHGACRAR